MKRLVTLLIAADLTGRIVLRSPIADRYDVDYLAAGVYQLHVLGADGTIIAAGKFVKD